MFYASTHRHEYIHHQDPGLGSTIRELVFGMEDGMVSTLGSITGIAAATQHPFTIILFRFCDCVRRINFHGSGLYLSSKSERDIDERKLQEERTELKEYPEEEKQELVDMYAKDGWPRDLSVQMAEVASKTSNYFCRKWLWELKIFPKI